jgi:S1-C subfamily serine protease
MKKKILALVVILIFGGIGGILMDRALFPFLSRFQIFINIKFISEPKNVTQIIQRTEQITVKEDDALELSIEKVSPVIGVVLIKDKSGKILNQFSGTSLTADGLVLTVNDSLGKLSNAYFLNRDGKEFPLSFVKRDDKLGIATLKTKDANLSSVPFAEIEKIKLGEKVFLVGAKSDSGKFVNFTNEGIIKLIGAGIFGLNFTESLSVSGSSLFNIKGEMVGMNLVSASGEIKVVTADRIKEFIK